MGSGRVRQGKDRVVGGVGKRRLRVRQGVAECRSVVKCVSEAGRDREV